MCVNGLDKAAMPLSVLHEQRRLNDQISLLSGAALGFLLIHRVAIFSMTNVIVQSFVEKRNAPHPRLDETVILWVVDGRMDSQRFASRPTKARRNTALPLKMPPESNTPTQIAA